jgi:hypothetical protein
MSIATFMLLGFFDAKCHECGREFGPFAKKVERSEADPDICTECAGEEDG